MAVYKHFRSVLLLGILCTLGLGLGAGAAYACGWNGATWLPWKNEPEQRNTYGIEVLLAQVEGEAAGYNNGCINAYEPGIGYYWSTSPCVPAGEAVVGNLGNGVDAEPDVINGNTSHSQLMWGWEYANLCLA